MICIFPRISYTYNMKDLKTRLTIAVDEYLGTIRADSRVSCCAWLVAGGKVKVAGQWPKWPRGFNGAMALTSCSIDSRTDVIVDRLLPDLEESHPRPRIL